MKIPYYVTRQAHADAKKWGYWAPCLARRNPKTGNIEPSLMAQLGFKLVDCGEDGPLAWAKARSCNEQWKEARRRHRAGEPLGKIEKVYPQGSVGEGFARFKGTYTWNTGKKPRTREDWERGWKNIEPMFGDVDPKTVTFEIIDQWYAALLELVGVREAHRAMKIWRALWQVLASMNYCDKDRDPSQGVRRKTPKPRNAIWFEGEAVRLVKRAWRMGFHGLAGALAVAWDTLWSPVDVRTLTTAQLKSDAAGPLFALERTKTGRAGIGTVSKRTARLLLAYVDLLPFTLHPDTPIFHTRGGEPGSKGGRPRPPVPYQKDKLAADFRLVREAEFPGDTRQIMDFRRSGTVEATAGEVDLKALAGKLANSIDRNKALQDTYMPHTASLVRLADAARTVGRNRLRGSREGSK